VQLQKRNLHRAGAEPVHPKSRAHKNENPGIPSGAREWNPDAGGRIPAGRSCSYYLSTYPSPLLHPAASHRRTVLLHSLCGSRRRQQPRDSIGPLRELFLLFRRESLPPAIYEPKQTSIFPCSQRVASLDHPESPPPVTKSRRPVCL